MRPDLTIEDARELPHEELLERCYSILAKYEPQQVEIHPQKVERLSKTIDEVPVLYLWFLQLKSYFNHWNQASSEMFKQSDRQAVRFRQRRDLFEDMASAAKMRYESASRQITLLIEFEPGGLHRSRVGTKV